MTQVKIIAIILWIGVLFGLGLISIKDHNRALLVKWIWIFGVEKESLWRHVVVVRFWVLSIWEAKEVHVRDIGVGFENPFKKIKDVFWKFIRFKLGSDIEIRFWEHR